MLTGICRGWLIHHPQHFRPPGFQKTPHQQRRQKEECDVEPSRIIPSDVRLYDLRRMLLRHQTGKPEDQLDHIGRARHGGIRDPEQ
jgi:hypothetical protein